jgi:RNA polymerase sigma-70 factor (sigma-E family)
MVMRTRVGAIGRSAMRTGRLEEAYRQLVPDALALSYLLTGSRPAAEDLVHDAFVRLAGRFEHLRHREALPAYMRRTIIHLHISRLRRLRVERTYLVRFGAEGRPPEPEVDVADREDLWIELQALPPRQRAAVVLRYYQDLSERETAEVLGCSVAAVKSLVARGLTTLRAQVRGEDS